MGSTGGLGGVVNVLETAKDLLGQKGMKGSRQGKVEVEMGIWGGSFIPIHRVVIHSGAGEFGDFFDPRKYHRNCPCTH